MEYWTDMELINFLELSYNLFYLPHCENEEQKSRSQKKEKQFYKNYLTD